LQKGKFIFYLYNILTGEQQILNAQNHSDMN